MDLTVKVLGEAAEPKEVDIARFSLEKDSIDVEFAKIIEKDVLEVRANIRIPIQDALPLLVQFIRALQDHEEKYKTGHGLPTSEIEKNK